jgi:hypothetical protein
VIHAILIEWLDDEGRTMDAWPERVKRYDQQAAQDFAMYAWLESQGKLPPPTKGVKPRHVKAWQQAQGVRA